MPPDHSTPLATPPAASPDGLDAASVAALGAALGAVVLFDGVCNLCNGAVNFLIDRDPHKRLRFAALQSPVAAALLTRLGAPPPPTEPTTMVLIEGGRLHVRSSAGLRIARHLRLPWNLLSVFIVVPRPLRDLLYRFVARHRYQWFGKSAACRVPTPELRARFLSDDDLDQPRR